MEVHSLGKTKRNGRQERIRGGGLRRRGFARGSQAVYKVGEEGKAASKKQIPSAPAAEESQKEGRGPPITRIKAARPSIAFCRFRKRLGSLPFIGSARWRSRFRAVNGLHRAQSACRTTLVLTGSGERRGRSLLQLAVPRGLDPLEPQITRGCADADRFLPVFQQRN